MPESTENSKQMVGDQPTTNDDLGFTPYVIAIAEFLTDKNTKPPLTISIEGEWGSGKSSFMEQLEAEVKRKSKELDEEDLEKIRQEDKFFIFFNFKFWKLRFKQKTQTVWFNAWRHEKSESLWAAFALSFLEQLSKNRNFLDFLYNLWSQLLLFYYRFNFKDKPFKAIQTLLVSASIIGIILAIPFVSWNLGVERIPQLSKILADTVKTDSKEEEENQTTDNTQTNNEKDENDNKNPKLAGEENTQNSFINDLFKFVFGFSFGTGSIAAIGAGSLAAIGKLLAIIKDLIGDPKMDLTQYLESPNYDKQVAFVEKFHEDFSKIVNAYVGENEKVYVFIDDLDRCELGKSADLLQALNMMISNNPKIIFILGMDREKVAAAISFKQRNVIPFLASAIAENQTEENEDHKLSKKVDYGFSFLEKFVQLSFSVPAPSQKTLDSFIEKMSEMQAEKIEVEESSVSEQNLESQDADTSSPDLPIFPIIEKDLGKKSFAQLIKMVAPFFDYNPRRLKQYINVLRLKTYIAYYVIGVTFAEKETITTEQIGKFIAITLRYPRLLLELKNNNQLLARLEKDAANKSIQSSDFIILGTESTPNNQETGNTNYWLKNYPKIQQLLSSEMTLNNEQKSSKKYIFENASIKKLLEVSPQQSLPSKYLKLRDFLAANKWKEADEETYRVMLQVASQQKEGLLKVKDIEKFPCKDLRTIDQLWVKYSDGKFGFSVQKEIYYKIVGGTSKSNEQVRDEFVNAVGWPQNEGVNYDKIYLDDRGYLNTPYTGYLPFLPLFFVHRLISMGSLEVLYYGISIHSLVLFSRAQNCKL